MDIIDILLAKSLIPAGSSDEAASAQAQAAAAQAMEAASRAQEALDSLPEETLTAEDITTELKKIQYNTYYQNVALNKQNVAVQLTYPDNTKSNYISVGRLYDTTGTDRSGSINQKALTEILETKADKAYVDEAIASIPTPENGEASTINLGSEHAGNIVVIGEDGKIIASDTSEASIIEALIKSGAYTAKNALGLEIDYENKSTTRTQDAINLQAGADFNQYTMFGGRMRCNVADDGYINAFYGDSNYKDDGSNGQVMIYQPKFYYQRVPIKTERAKMGQIIRKESIIISEVEQNGFKLHPIFKDTQGNELDYVLLPAYEGSIISNKLASVSDQKPVSNISITEAEQYAQNRGSGWHIMNMAAESANQLLEIIEFGSMNGQTSLESGIVSIPSVSGTNCSSQTGSTAYLGNNSGTAVYTTNITKNNTVLYEDEGKRAISYRGMENPWGNIWCMIGGINVSGNGQQEGGIPYICTDFNYNINSIRDNYESIGFCLPSNYNWISAMGYGNEKYDWVFMPIECSSSANSIAPVGDNLWTNANQNGITQVSIGGSWGFGQSSGPFYYACDNFTTSSAGISYGASLMFIPTINNIYSSNHEKWLAKMKG